MSDEAVKNTSVATTTPVVMAFPVLAEPRRFKQNGKESGELNYSAMFIFDPASEDLKRLKAAVIATAQARWPGRDIGASFKAGQFGLPFSSGNDQVLKAKEKAAASNKEYDGRADFMEGKVVFKAKSKFQPRLAFIENGRISAPLEGPALKQHAGKFYFGAEVLFEVALATYDKVGSSGTDGVKAYLSQVLTTGKGKRLTGGQDPASTFAAYAGKLSTEDPTQGRGSDDEIPF
jgi:hypothetical protein